MIQLKRILLPTDFSELAAPAVRYAVAFAEQFEAELHLLHVVQPLPVAPDYVGTFYTDYPLRAEEAAFASLKTVVDPKWQESHATVHAVRHGSSFVEIIRYAKENEVELVVMSTHGRSGLLTSCSEAWPSGSSARLPVLY